MVLIVIASDMRRLLQSQGKQVIVVKDDGTEINLSDALTATDAVPQFKSQERRAESTEEQLKGLLQALQTVTPRLPLSCRGPPFV